MNKSIKIYKLERCGFCSNLTEILTVNSIPFKALDAYNSENRSDCEKLDKFFESERYPKVIVEKGSKSIFIVPFEGTRISNFGDVIFEYFNDVDEATAIIKKYYNEI